jgi:hypothetical protein
MVQRLLERAWQQISHEEQIERNADRIEDQGRFSAFLARSQSGFFLLGQGLTYSIGIAAQAT